LISYYVANELQFLERLLEISTDVRRLINGKDEESNSALAMVCMEGHQDIVKILYQHGADIEITSKQGRTPL
jgi:ankyrin repeat protein